MGKCWLSPEGLAAFEAEGAEAPIAAFIAHVHKGKTSDSKFVQREPESGLCDSGDSLHITSSLEGICRFTELWEKSERYQQGNL